MNDSYIMFKVKQKLKEQLKKEAKLCGLTLSSYIKLIISKRKK